MRECKKSLNSISLFGVHAATLVTMLVSMLIAINAKAATNLLTNGDFETGNLSGWTWTPTLFSDSAMDPTVVTFETAVGQPSLCFSVNPGPDFNHIGQQQGGALSQTINLVAGTEYAVSIGAAAMQNSDASNLEAGRIRLYIGSSLLWDWDVGDIPGFMTVRNSYSGTYTPAVSGPYDFELLFTRTSKELSPVMYHYLDNTSVVVPEPTTIVLLGFGALNLLRRKRWIKK